uniref:FBA_2 domain-containing protein n=1 Tax=Panagrellus redivivus TaxID=6233 RepID=A0A7E4UWA1_PANRE
MTLEINFTNATAGFDVLQKYAASTSRPLNSLTITNAKVTREFLNSWQKATNGYKTSALHVTILNCDFDSVPAYDIGNFCFGFFRSIAMKVEGDVDHFLEALYIDERITQLHNLRIISTTTINIDEGRFLNRIFRPGTLEVVELRGVNFSETFINKLIQRFRESNRATRCVSRLFLGGQIPWPLHQINFQKQKLGSTDRDKYRFKNRFGYYVLDIEYSNNMVDLRIAEGV